VTAEATGGARLAPPGTGRAADFVAPPWLANPHVQSVWPSLPVRRRAVLRRCRDLLEASEPVLLDCGEDVRLLALRAMQERAGRPSAARMVVLLHGWEGSANSLYVLSLGQYLFARGFDVLRLNLRDHGDSHHLNAGIFHSCRIAEVVGAVQRVQQQHPDRALSLVGFSLGGNFCLRVGARATDARLELDRIIAVCPVIDPEHTLARLEEGWLLYRRYFVWKWRRSLEKKQAAWPGLYDLREVRRMGDLRRMTDCLAREHGGFPSLDAYLRGYAVTDRALEPIAVPTRIIAASDDPLIPAADLARLAAPPALEILRTAHGGHCGYFDLAAGGSWLEREVLTTLQSRRR
jgi:predicted alpha/beta-fold hydrolase